MTASLADEPSPRLLERYLTLAWESGARPAILLLKADLEADPERVAQELAEVAGDVPIAVVSTRAGLGLDRVRSLLAPGTTGALVGPSGVGKSTLVNRLVGEELLDTGEVAEDGSGRHTTTRRQLVVVPGAGVIVDNPGIRELHLWLADEGLDEAFADIVELASRCRFADCRHETEPGCAVQEALASGELSRERWESYRELQRELAELEERLARRVRCPAPRPNPGAGTPEGDRGAPVAAPGGVGGVNSQSAAASSWSSPSGIRDSEPSCVFESATVSGSIVPSTRLYVCPSITAAVIAPSYDRASSRACVDVFTSATPSGEPFCASISTTRYAPAAREPESVDRAYSWPSPPLTSTSAMPSRLAAEDPMFLISTKPAESAPTWS